MENMLEVEADDIHLASRIILQRQFFEAIARSAAVKYANRADLPTLAEKMDHLFKTKLAPNAGKNKSKSLAEDVRFLVKALETIQDCRLGV